MKVGMKQANIKVWQDGYIDSYPQFSELADTQISIFWPHGEIKVEKDKQDLLVGMTESEKHGVITTLKLFVAYELYVGNEHWASRIAKAYPQVGVQRMAAAFAHVELNSHAPFYARINEELGLATMEFYTSYLNDPVLSSRMAFIDEVISNSDDELSTAVFSLVEGAVLYSNFAFLKSFQTKGLNKISNIVRGINMSARDENLHAIGGAGIVRVALSEQQRTSYEMAQFAEAVQQAAHIVYEHECAIVDKVYEKGGIEGSNPDDVKTFVKSRLNLCLDNVGVPRIFKVEANPIGDVFYKGVNDYQYNDIFAGVGREYSRAWSKTEFSWPKNA